MTDQPLVRDLLALPEQAEKGDFVVKLTDGLREAERTIRDYVVTRSIHDALDQALTLVGSCLRDGSSRAAYLHGSFGSGKSHFMAVLGLLHDAHPAAWGHRDLQDLRPRHSWVGEKRLLRVAVHMLGQPGLRDAVFDQYLAALRREHPDAPAPGLYLDEGLFQDALTIRGRMGDAAFFGALNDGLEGGSDDSGWGDLAASDVFDAARFDEALASSDEAVRAALRSRLVAKFFPNTVRTHTRYVDFDAGLAEISRHARSLGYDGIVLLLDELILWLAGRIANRTLVTQEVEHTVKLVEAQHGDRAIPIVAFIARQRSLKDLVGAHGLGVDTIHLEEQLSHAHGRFSTIYLEERNLPEIVGRRLLRPKDDAAREVIDRAFARVVDAVHGDWQTLLGNHGDQESFRKLYPFSPALIDSLVAISDCLQRERTALKMLADMLVDHMGDLRLGHVVPVGDLFDLVAAGDPIDEPSLRHKFDRAKDIYQRRILPVLWEEHQTGTAEKCQRLRPDHRVSIGCAMCPNVPCRTSNRLMKTLLLADMVPNLSAFQNLTVMRLVGLNHGVIHSPIPGQEGTLASKLLRRCAPRVPELRIGEEDDPSVRLSLDAVDIEPILQKAAQVDNEGARRRVLKEVLFAALGMDGAREDDIVREIRWKGTKRRCRVIYGNVREMQSRDFMATDAEDVRLVLDYPFDEKGHAPDEDVRAVEKFKDSHPDGTATVVWLPSFFSADTLSMLGRLVRLEYINRNHQQYLSHLRVEDQERARAQLESIAQQTRAGIRDALEKAYGLVGFGETDRALDPSRRLAQHFWCLLPDKEIQGLIQTDFLRALESLVPQVLHFCHPKHPDLGKSAVTDARLEKVRAALNEMREKPEPIAELSHPATPDLRDIAKPLGLVEETRMGHRVSSSRVDDLERQRLQQSLDTPTVGQMRRMLDPAGQVGLPASVEDLLILAWADQHDRELQSLGQPVPAQVGRLENGQQLCAQAMPSVQEWQRALILGRSVFGHARGKELCSAKNVREFVSELRHLAKPRRRAVDDVASLLSDRLRLLGAKPEGARLLAAIEASQVLAIVEEGDPVDVVRGLAGLELTSSETAIGRAQGGADGQLRALRNDLPFEMILRAGQADATFLARAVDVLNADEVAVPLESEIAKLAKEATAHFGAAAAPKAAPVAPPAAPAGSVAPPPVPGQHPLVERTCEDITEARALLDELRKHLDGNPDFVLTVRLVKKGGSDL